MKIETILGFAAGVVAGATASVIVCQRIYNKRIDEVTQQINEIPKDAKKADFSVTEVSEEDYTEEVDSVSTSSEYCTSTLSTGCPFVIPGSQCALKSGTDEPEENKKSDRPVEEPDNNTDGEDIIIRNDDAEEIARVRILHEEDPMKEEREEFLEEEWRHDIDEMDRAAEGDSPYLMTEEDFWNTEGKTDGDELRYLSYWIPDNIFTNEEDEELKPEELADMIGVNATDVCRTTNEDEIFVRNPVRNLFYEIFIKKEHFNAAL